MKNVIGSDKRDTNESVCVDKNQYKIYCFTPKEIIICILQCIAICGIVDYLFYQNIWFMISVIPVCFFFYRGKKKYLLKERKKKLNYQFKDALNSLNVAVQAGYSIENSLSLCLKDMLQIYSERDDIIRELRYMDVQRQMSVPVEDLFVDFAERCGLEDVQNFAAVFLTAKRTGGDMGMIIQKVSRMLSDKIEVHKEIESTLASKKWEQLVMAAMPVGIILYMKLSSPGFLDVLYGNVIGIGAMTVCLLIYLTAIWMGNKIVDIEV